MVYNSFINDSVWLQRKSSSQTALSLSLYIVSIHKAPPESNLASQCRLNDHKFQGRKKSAVVPYQQSCCKPFYESKPGIMVLPSDNCSVLCGSLSEMLSVKTSFWKHTVVIAIKLFLCFCKFKWLFGLHIFISFFCMISPLSLIHTLLRAIEK